MAEIVFGLALVPFLPDSDNADGGTICFCGPSCIILRRPFLFSFFGT